jgi:hypothetical protein
MGFDCKPSTHVAAGLGVHCYSVSARAALFVQQMKANVVVFDSRIEFDRDGDQTEREDAAGDGPSHR